MAIYEDDAPIVEIWLKQDSQATRVSGCEAPLSLSPFRIGILTSVFGAEPPTTAVWEVRAREDIIVGEMALKRVSILKLHNVEIAAYAPYRSRNRSVSSLRRAWRYALAHRHARATASRPGLRMTAADLRSLDVYYIRPRPVYLVTVPHGDGFNIFPMDLVDFIADDAFFILALRTTSPSVPHIKQRRVLAVSSVSYQAKEAIYALGAHHKTSHQPGAELPLALGSSPSLGLPVPANAFRVRELQVHDFADIGSHSVFIAEIGEEYTLGRERHLGHVSGLFASSPAGRPFSLTEV